MACVPTILILVSLIWCTKAVDYHGRTDYTDSTCSNIYQYFAYKVGQEACSTTETGSSYLTCTQNGNDIGVTAFSCNGVSDCSANCQNIGTSSYTAECTQRGGGLTTYAKFECVNSVPRTPYDVRVHLFADSGCTGNPKYVLSTAMGVCQRDTADGTYYKVTLNGNTLTSAEDCTDASCTDCRTTQVLTMDGTCRATSGNFATLGVSYKGLTTGGGGSLSAAASVHVTLGLVAIGLLVALLSF
jgi:hypothetical protein